MYWKLQENVRKGPHEEIDYFGGDYIFSELTVPSEEKEEYQDFRKKENREMESNLKETVDNIFQNAESKFGMIDYPQNAEMNAFL